LREEEESVGRRRSRGRRGMGWDRQRRVKGEGTVEKGAIVRGREWCRVRWGRKGIEAEECGLGGRGEE
jgi:hypothetical protein